MGYITEIIKDIQQGNAATPWLQIMLAYQAALVPSPLDGTGAKTQCPKTSRLFGSSIACFLCKKWMNILPKWLKL